MESINWKMIDNLLQIYSKKYFLYKKIKRYKEKLQKYEHFDLKNIPRYEKKWKKYKKKYKQIMIHGIQFVSIGETVPRIFNLLEDINNAEKEILHVVMPVFFESYTGEIYNRRMFDIFGKKIYFIRASNIAFWIYIFCFHMKDINTEQFDQYKDVRLGGIKVDLGKALLPFSDAETLEGENKLRKIGIKGEFVCLHARESKVKSVNFNKQRGYNSRCLNCDINTFVKTSRYFADLNVQSVRMGKYETKECPDKTIIDYANKYYDEFMDFYLLSRCKFMISCDTGFTTICGYWGRPVLATNMVTLCYGGESYPDTGYSMYMPKKFYSKKENRYLNLYEMLDVMDKCMIYSADYQKAGIILEENSEDEILEAAIEMNNRLDGVWIESEEEKKCYDRYWKILHMWEQQHETIKARQDLKGYTMFFSKPSYSYLRENPYLLNCDL